MAKHSCTLCLHMSQVLCQPAGLQAICTLCVDPSVEQQAVLCRWEV